MLSYHHCTKIHNQPELSDHKARIKDTGEAIARTNEIPAIDQNIASPSNNIQSGPDAIDANIAPLKAFNSFDAIIAPLKAFDSFVKAIEDVIAIY